MVITVYADRRSNEVGDIAERLTDAIAACVGRDGVILLDPRRLAAPDASARLRDMAGRYAATVVALSGAPNEQVLAAFDASDRVLLVTHPSVPSIRGTQRTLKLCASLGYGAEKLGVVLHDFGDDAPLGPADAVLALKRDIYWTLEGTQAAEPARMNSYAGLARRLLQRE
jgi:Flp pilus assembly CpaE family ATPase